MIGNGVVGVELLPPTIHSPDLLLLLGQILRPDLDPATVAKLRFQLMRPGFSWQSLIDLATQQDVLPPLILTLVGRGLLPPVPRAANVEGHVTQRLTDAYEQHLERQERLKQQLERILAALNEAGVAALLLKGARYLVAPLGAWCQARTMRDIDLLIHPGDGERVLTVLTALGYRNGPFIPLRHHHLPELCCDDEPAMLEIHTAVHSLEAERAMSTAEVWAEARSSADAPVLVMPNKWQALHCMLHHQLSDLGYRRRILAVKALWEWTMLAREFSEQDWKVIMAQMRAANASDVMASWLIQAQRLFGAVIPAFIHPSPTAIANAEGVFRFASKPHWLRRTIVITDQLRFSFARETLAMRYGKSPSQISPLDAGKYAMRLLRVHRGRMLLRLMGRGDRLS